MTVKIPKSVSVSDVYNDIIRIWYLQRHSNALAAKKKKKTATAVCFVTIIMYDNFSIKKPVEKSWSLSKRFVSYNNNIILNRSI